MEAELKIPESRPQAGGTISGRHGQEPQAGCISPSTQCGTPDRTEEEGEEGGGGGGGAPVGRAGSDALALSACGNARVASNSLAAAAAVLCYCTCVHFSPCAACRTRASPTRSSLSVLLSTYLFSTYLLKCYILHMHGDEACDNPRPSCAEERRRR